MSTWNKSPKHMNYKLALKLNTASYQTHCITAHHVSVYISHFHLTEEFQYCQKLHPDHLPSTRRCCLHPPAPSIQGCPRTQTASSPSEWVDVTRCWQLLRQVPLWQTTVPVIINHDYIGKEYTTSIQESQHQIVHRLTNVLQGWRPTVHSTVEHFSLSDLNITHHIIQR